ncbi:TPA: acyltransferase [Proteus mirabilis]
MPINKNISESIDLLRVIACFLVVTLHSSAIWFYSFSDFWWKVNIIDSLTRVSVPLFIMITGVLLINEKNIDYSTIPKRITRAIKIIFFWSAIYYLTYSEKNINIIDFIYKAIFNDIKFHFWYLYALIGFYISIPILSSVYKNSNSKTIFIIILLWSISSNVELLSFFIPSLYSVKYIYNIEFLSNFIGYLILGKLLSDIFLGGSVKIKSLYLFALYFAFSTLTAFATYIISNNKEPNLLFYSYTSPMTIIASSFIFLFILKSTAHVNNAFKKKIKTIANLTLGIYCIHILILEKLSLTIMNKISIDNGFSYMLLLSMVTFVISLSIIYILKKIKPIEKLV